MKIIYSILILCFSVFAQSRYTGVVFDAATNLPLKGANVYLKHDKAGSTTDSDGFFSFSSNKIVINDTLLVFFLGYEEHKIPVSGNRTNLVIKIQPLIIESEEGITVEADRIDLSQHDVPHVSNVISVKTIEQYGTSEIADLFKIDPTVHIEGNDLDGKKIQIRGSDADEVNVYVDGILINGIGLENAADLSILPVENIEKIEILKGPNLMLLGNGAFGGVVNITTSRKLEKTYDFKFKTGSFSNYYVSGSTNLPIRNNFFFNYFGLYQSIRPEIEYYPSERFSDKTESSSSQSIKQNHHISMSYFLSGGHITSKIIGYMFDYKKPYWQNNSQNMLLATSYTGTFLGFDNFDFSANYHYSNDDINRKADRDRSFKSEYQTQRINFRVVKNFQLYDPEAMDLNFQVLTEYYHDEAVNRNFFNNFGEKITLYNSYLYENRAATAGVINFGEIKDSSLAGFHWKAFAGIRGDFLSSGNSYKTNNFGFDLGYNFEKIQTGLFLAYGENIKFPTLLENAYLEDIQDYSLQNEDGSLPLLKPETSTGSELGLELKYEPESAYFNQADFKSSFFTSRIYNKIIERPLEGVIIKTQLGENFTNGFETSLKLNELFSDYEFRIAYTVLQVDEPLLYAYKPKSKLSTQLSYFNREGFYFTAAYFHEGESNAIYYDQFNNLRYEEIDPFFDFDLIFGYRIRIGNFKTDFQLAAYNLLDNSGYLYYYLKKRFLQAGVSIHY